MPLSQHTCTPPWSRPLREKWVRAWLGRDLRHEGHGGVHQVAHFDGVDGMQRNAFEADGLFADEIAFEHQQ